ncbi:MAG: hypothetical protein U0746_11795 [Gemmataceae bacterium]
MNETSQLVADRLRDAADRLHDIANRLTVSSRGGLVPAKVVALLGHWADALDAKAVAVLDRMDERGRGKP